MRYNFLSFLKELGLPFKSKKCKIVTGLTIVAITAAVAIVSVLLFFAQKDKPKENTEAVSTSSASTANQNHQRRAESGNYNQVTIVAIIPTIRILTIAIFFAQKDKSNGNSEGVFTSSTSITIPNNQTGAESGNYN